MILRRPRPPLPESLRRLLLFVPFLMLAGMPSAAYAHKLKVFAIVEDQQVHGYAFFIGGGRAAHANWQASAGGNPLVAGHTDDQGRFAFAAPVPVADTVVTVNTGEGHMASSGLPASRFLGIADPAAADDPSAGPASGSPGRNEAALIEAAVQRQVAPLMERIEQMDSRLSLTDIVSGMCLILGLGGIALWVTGRRRA